MAAQSHVAVSFELPEYTSNADALGTLRILEAIIKLKLKSKFYQAGTSEMFGKIQSKVQNEKLHFILKVLMGQQNFIHMITKNYREAYGNLLLMEFI